MAAKESNHSALIVALLPTALLLLAYAGWLNLLPSQDVERMESLAAEVKQLEAEQTPQEERLRVASEIKELQDSLDEEQSRLAALQSVGNRVFGAKIDSIERLETNRRMSQVLGTAGLTMLGRSDLDEQSGKLTSSLEEATGQLGETLKKISDNSADAVKIEVPKNLPSDVNPLQWIAQQRRLLSGKFERTAAQTSELRMVGDYSAMVRGLEGVVDACPNVVVTSVGFEKSDETKASAPLVWTVRLELRPTSLQPSWPGGSSQTESIAIVKAVTAPMAETQPTSANVTRREELVSTQSQGRD